jgi:hypothetical protein
MKKLLLIALIPLALTACQKSGTNPTKITASKHDTIPDTGYFKVQLIKDSTIKNGTNEILVVFNHKFHLSYNSTGISEDAAVPGWNPNLNILAITSDGILVNEDGVPYSPGVSIPLFITATDGPYLIKAYLLKKIPSDIHIWCKDNYLKDSLDLNKGNYSFTINNADTNSFDKKRFQIVVRPQ